MHRNKMQEVQSFRVIDEISTTVLSRHKETVKLIINPKLLFLDKINVI